MKLSDKLRPSSEASPWVIEQVKKLEAELDEARAEVERLRALNEEWKKLEKGLSYVWHVTLEKLDSARFELDETQKELKRLRCAQEVEQAMKKPIEFAVKDVSLQEARELLHAVAMACRGLGPVTDEVLAVVGNVLTERDEARAEAKTLRRALKLLWEEANDESRCTIEHGHHISEQCRKLVEPLVGEDDT